MRQTEMFEYFKKLFIYELKMKMFNYVYLEKS